MVGPSKASSEIYITFPSLLVNNVRPARKEQRKVTVTFFFMMGEDSIAFSLQFHHSHLEILLSKSAKRGLSYFEFGSLNSLDLNLIH